MDSQSLSLIGQQVQLSFGQVAALLQGCLHSVRHSMHDLAWRTQKMQESTQAVNEALLRHLQAIAPPAAAQAAPPLQPPARPQAAQPATQPRQPQQPPPAEMLRQAPQTPPAAPPAKLQPRITSQTSAKPPLQNPRGTRQPPPAVTVTRPTPPAATPAAQSQQSTPPPRKLLCPKPQTPATKAQPRTAGKPVVDCHLHALFLGCDPTGLQLALTVMH